MTATAARRAPRREPCALSRRTRQKALKALRDRALQGQPDAVLALIRLAKEADGAEPAKILLAGNDGRA